MALTSLTDNLNIVSALDDEPNDVGGLSATELKAKFDAAANLIKAYLNGTLLPELVAAGVNSILQSSDLSTLKYIRLGTGDVIEVSADGTNWTTIAAAGGHIVCASDGSEATQRNKLKFVNLTVSDDGTYTAITAQAPNAATTGTLLAAGWASNSQTISVAGVTANNCVIVSPSPTSRTAYNDANVSCTAQGNGTLSFGCETAPTVNLTVNVLILAVE